MPRPALRRRQPQKLSPKGRGIPSSPTARAELERKLAHKPVGQRPVDSDDSDRLVVKSKGSNRKRSAPPTEIYCSGGVAKGDQPNAYPTRAERRRKLERETEEIASQSRSREASTDPGNAIRQSQEKASPKPNVSNAKAKALPAFTATSIEPNTFAAPTGSLFSGLKPRRRQNSILSQLANGDTSSINSDDEADFLPQDQSTPILKKPQSAPNSITQPLDNSATRKRKQGSDVPVLSTTKAPSQTGVSTNQILDNADEEPGLAPMLSPTLKRATPKQRPTRNDDDILAPPRSSSSDSDSYPVKIPASTKSGKKISKPKVLSTEQLQSFMPTKRRQTARQKSQKDQFDIPSDTSNAANNTSVSEAENDSSFLPRSKRTKKKETTKSAKITKSSKRSGVSVTPLRPTRNRSTKSPSQQPFLDARGSASKGKGNEHRSYGGFHHRKASGKENAKEEDGQNVEAPEVVNVQSPDLTTKAAVTPQPSSKWADIDAWDMDFEEVEVVTGSSSPMRR